MTFAHAADRRHDLAGRAVAALHRCAEATATMKKAVRAESRSGAPS
jgi:hypothetical protein